MPRCVFCRRRIWPWPWVRIGWMVGHGAWHPRCFREALREANPSLGKTWTYDPPPMTLAEIQAILDEAQA